MAEGWTVIECQCECVEAEQEFPCADQIYPDVAHGSIFQYAEDAAARTVAFLAD